MPRPGGNPNLTDYQFKTERLEPLVKQLSFRVGKTMNSHVLDKKIPNWQELMRLYLAGLIKEKGYDVPDY